MEHNTRTLYPGNYLHHFLPTVPEWEENAQPALQRIAVLWRAMDRNTPGRQASVARTVMDFVLPVMRTLGWDVGTRIHCDESLQGTLPQYALYPDPASQPVPYPGINYADLTDSVHRQTPPIALMVRPWSSPLARRNDTESASRPNADQQMVRYLVQTETPWGILTNGRQWRLYGYRREGTTSNYYQADLTPVFDISLPPTSKDPRQIQFRRWWLFFRKKAFAPTDYGSTFVERMKTGAQAYTQFVANKLRGRVVNEAIPELIAALIIYYRESAIRMTHVPELDEVKSASLDFVYRLLFLIYAETNDLFPSPETSFASHGVKDVVSWALSCSPADDYAPAGTSSYAQYDKIIALMQGLGTGQHDWALPRYAIRLAGDRDGIPDLLREYRLNDWALAKTITALMHDMEQAYGALQVRDVLFACQELNRYEIELINEATGEAFFSHPEQDPLDEVRDASPTHVQNYAIEHVLEVMLVPRREAYNTVMQQVVNLRRKRDRGAAHEQMQVLEQDLRTASKQAVDALLGIRILDPVMGTGDRLLQVTDRLTDALICTLQRFHDEHPKVPWAWNPIAALLDDERRRIQTDLVRQGLTAQDDDLSDTALLRHFIVTRCIYGMDMDPMSVKLSQLGLWMHAFTTAAPVDQLHSHLRAGNPLLGSQLSAMEQSLTAQLGAPVVMMPDVDQHVSMTLQAKADARHTPLTSELNPTPGDPWEPLLPYKRLLDVYLAERMDMPGVRNLVKEQGVTLLEALKGNIALSEDDTQILEDVRSAWKTQRFFHYDMEFPEVFIVPEDVALQGFDAILADPATLPALERPSRDALVRLSDGAPIADTEEAWRSFVQRQFVKRCTRWLKSSGHIGLVVGGRVMVTQKVNVQHTVTQLGL